MTLQQFAPNVCLHHFVKHYWVMDMEEPVGEKEELLFPLGAVEIIFHLKTSLLRPSASGWQHEKNAFVEGQQSGTIWVKQKDVVKTVGITLYPWATYVFFRVSPATFNNANFSIDELPGGFNKLYEELLLNGNKRNIPGLCNSFLIALLKQNQPSYTSPERAIVNAFKQLDRIGIENTFKSKWNYSSRLFENKFRQLIGVSAGEILKKKRMNAVLKMMLYNHSRSLTDVAHSAGYYDQSHFIKDFKTYFHFTPKYFDRDNRLLKHFI